MPDFRLLQPSAGNSAKLSGLSHLEHRAWTQCLLSADDFGVMRQSASVVRGDNAALEREPFAEIEACLKQLVSVGLLLEFDHQGLAYVCDPVWQDHQHVRYPRRSHHPVPSPEVLKRCSDATRKLFAEFRKSAKSSKGSAKLAHANANANADLFGKEKSARKERGKQAAALPSSPVRTLLDAYVARFKERYGTAPQVDYAKDGAIFKALASQHAIEMIAGALDTYFGDVDPFIARSGHTLTLFRSQFNRFLAAASRPASQAFGTSPRTAGNFAAAERFVSRGVK